MLVGRRLAAGWPLWAIVCACVAAVLLALSLSLSPHAPRSQHGLIRSIGYFADPGGQMTVAQVARSASFSAVAPILTRGYSKDAHWLRLTLAPKPAEVPLILTVGVPNLDQISLFIPDPHGGWSETRSGDRLAFRDRPWKSPLLGFVMPESGIAAQTVYLRVQTSGTSAMLVDLVPEGEAYARLFRMGVIQALFYGLMITALALSIGLYFYSGDTVLLWFAASHLTYTLMTASFSGYVSVALPMLATHGLTSVLTIGSGILNTLFHLQLLRRFAPARGMLLIGQAMAMIQIASLLINVFYDETFGLGLSMLLSTFSMLFLAALAFTARTSAHLSLQGLRAVYTIYGLSILIWLLPAAGIGIAGRYSIYAVQVQGLLNFVLVLSMLSFLALRTRRAAEAAQAAVVALNAEAEAQAQTALAQRNLTWMLAHEVATALSIIRLATAKEPLSARNATRIDRAISSLDQVMQHCVEVGRIESARWKPTPARCDLVALAKDALAQFDTQGRPVMLDLPPVAMIQSDPELVRLAFAHLIDNALKYAPARAQVTLRLGPLVPASGYRFAVENPHMPGAAPDVGKVFNKFYRDDRVLGLSGSGLGLFIARDVVGTLGGHVDMDVSNGIVTTWITLGDLA